MSLQTLRRIRCDHPGCPAELELRPGESPAQARSRAAALRWGWPPSGRKRRDLCPEHAAYLYPTPADRGVAGGRR